MLTDQYQKISIYIDHESPTDEETPLKSAEDYKAYFNIRSLSIGINALKTPDPVTSEVIIDRVLDAIDSNPLWNIF